MVFKSDYQRLLISKFRACVVVNGYVYIYCCLRTGADSSQDGQQGSSIGDDGDSLGDESYVPPEFVDSPVKSDKTKPKKRK